MSSVTKPIMLNETGEQIVQKLAEVAESNRSYEKLLDTKADKVDVSAPFNFKGETTYASLPTSGNEINDTYYCSDKKCRYTWNGKGWYQSSMNEVDYTDELAQMASDISDIDSKLSSEIGDVQSKIDLGVNWSDNLVDDGEITVGSRYIWNGVVGNTLTTSTSQGFYRCYVMNVVPNKKYKVTLRMYSTTVSNSHIIFCNTDLGGLGVLLSPASDGNTYENRDIRDYEFTTPNDCYKVAINTCFSIPTDGRHSQNAFYESIDITVAEEFEKVDNRLSILESNAGDSIPSYLQENIDHIVSSKEGQNGNSLNIAFLTDLHYLAFGGASDKAKYSAIFSRCVQGIDEIDKKRNIDFTILGGDYLWNTDNTTKESAEYAYEELQKIFYPLKSNIFALKGNHDDNSMNTDKTTHILSDKEYGYLGQQFDNDNVVVNYGNAEKMYGYIDFKRQKVRCLLINTVDIPYIYDDVLRYKGQNITAMSQEQLSFFAKALEIKDEDWSVLVFSHHCLISADFIKSSSTKLASNHGGNAIWGMLQAFKNKTTFSVNGTETDFEYAISVDYTNNASNDVIACVCGHSHQDVSGVFDGIRLITTTACGFGQALYDASGNQLESGFTYETKTETAFDIYSIDRVNRKISIARFGFGDDREYTY